MTPDDTQDLEQQIAALNAGLENIMIAVTALTTTVQQGQRSQEEQSEALLHAVQEQDILFLRIASQLDELGSAFPRIGRELAEAALELRRRTTPKKKSRWGATA